MTEDKEKGKEQDKEASQETDNRSPNEDGTTIRSHKNRTDSNQLQEKTASLCIPGICVYSDSSDSDASTSWSSNEWQPWIQMCQFAILVCELDDLCRR